MSTAVHGRCDDRFREVREAFAENFASRGDVGATVAVDVDGETVVDLWGGFMDERRSRPWHRDTLVNVYSCTKGIVAVLAHGLVEQGLLDLETPVARYWPEFAQAGKESIPVKWLLSHQAGLPAARELLPLGAHNHWEVMAEALARSEPWWAPGTKVGYHVMSYGWLVGEVIRRVTGKSVGAYLQEQLARPLGVEFHIGMGPEYDIRTAEIILAPPPPRDRVDPMGERLRDKSSVTYMAVVNPKDMMARGTVNTRKWRAAEIPAANGHSHARGLARIYGALARGGDLNGVHVLSRDAIENATIEHAAGMDEVLGSPTRLGLGFMLNQEDRRYGPNARSFGHPGAGGGLGFADPDAGVGFGYAMNQMMGGMGGGDPRWKALIEPLYAALG